MTTALEPRLAAPARRRARADAVPQREPALQRADELDHLCGCWRTALDAAETALRTAPAVLQSEALQGRMTLLKAERTAVATLLEELARDLQVKKLDIARVLAH